MELHYRTYPHTEEHHSGGAVSQFIQPLSWQDETEREQSRTEAENAA